MSKTIVATPAERIASAVAADPVKCWRAIFGDPEFKADICTAWKCPWFPGTFLVVSKDGARAYQSDGTSTVPIGDITDAYCRSIGRAFNEANAMSIRRGVCELIGG